MSLSAPIPPLQHGDTVGLAAPARAVSPEEMKPAIESLQKQGYRVLVPDGLYERCGQLAGTDSHRAAVMQSLIDDDSIRAILCCRGGYGSVRIIDQIDFGRMKERPKWIVGYSDITVFHSHIHASLSLPTIHATMPIDFPADGSDAHSVRSLFRSLEGKDEECIWLAGRFSQTRGEEEVEGEVVGGNLSILYSLCGSKSQIDTSGKILLIEDLDEYIYHIDRMMQALRRSGMLEAPAAIIVGGMTKMHDNTIPFGLTAEECIAQAAAHCHCPILFGAPFGHLGKENIALTLGNKKRLTVSASGISTLA